MKARVITPCMSGEKIAALAITEPSGGSDVARIRTTARREGDEYVVNGSKTFITSGMRADFFTVAVRTGGEGPSGLSLLLVEGDRPGFERTKLDKMGWLASDTATLYFDDVRVPVENLITEEGAGFRAIVNNFNAERIDLAVQSTAFSRVCFDEAVAWARERETFGKRLADHQVIRHKLAEMDRMINASKAWLELLSWRLNQGDDPVAEIAEAKVNATLCFEACARTLLPSIATRPMRTAPASRANRSTWTNSPSSAARCRCRKSAIVRKSGWLFAASTRNARSSLSRRWIFRDEKTPTQSA